MYLMTFTSVFRIPFFFGLTQSYSSSHFIEGLHKDILNLINFVALHKDILILINLMTYTVILRFSIARRLTQISYGSHPQMGYTITSGFSPNAWLHK